MRAYLTFMVITVVLVGLVQLARTPELLRGLADDPVVRIVGVVALVLVGAALTLAALRLHRGPSPK